MDAKVELKREIESQRKDISSLKKKLDEQAHSKLGLYEKNREYYLNLHSLIERITAINKEHKEHSERFKKIASEKSMLYIELDLCKATLKEINNSISSLMEKHQFKMSSDSLQKRIEEIEYKIQTEVMSFEREKELNKIIKRMRIEIPKYAELDSLIKKRKDAFESIDNFKSKIAKLKDEIGDTKHILRALNKDSTAISSEIEKIRDDKDKIRESLKQTKVDIRTTKTILKDKIMSLTPVSARLDNMISSEKNSKRAYEERITKRKQEEVKEKIRRGEKLTTEDLIAYQGID